jgi:hypothetical protein
MRGRAALAALSLLASVTSAEAGYYYPFATNGVEFWRPASPEPVPALIHIDDDSLRLKTHCFSASMTFANKDGKAAFEGQYGSGANSSPSCSAERSGFEALRQMLRTVTGSHAVAGRLVLEGPDGRDAIVLEPIAPDGIEYRRLTVTAFRYRGKLLPLHDPDFVPDFVLYDGIPEGGAGCGGLFGDYRKVGPSRYRFEFSCILAGWCAPHSSWLVGKVWTAFGGVRNVEARGDDFVLRDRHGRIQIVLSPYKEVPS